MVGSVHIPNKISFTCIADYAKMYLLIDCFDDFLFLIRQLDNKFLEEEAKDLKKNINKGKK